MARFRSTLRPWSAFIGIAQTCHSHPFDARRYIVCRSHAGIGKALAEWDSEPTLLAYGGPILVLATEANDSPAALYRLRPGIPYEILAESGHWVMLDHPQVVAKATTTFVADVEAHQQ